MKKLFYFGFFPFCDRRPAAHTHTCCRTERRPTPNGFYKTTALQFRANTETAKQALRGRSGNNNAPLLRTERLPPPNQPTQQHRFSVSSSHSPLPSCALPLPLICNCLPQTKLWPLRRRLCLCCSAIVMADEKHHTPCRALYRTFKL